jgi:hypothetical protein
MQDSRPDRRPRSWTARILAPIALIATGLVVLLVVVGSLDGTDDSGGDRGERETDGCTPAAEQAVENGYYVLDEGENLTDVATKTCVDIERIEKLNPDLDPLALPALGCVDLVKDGCKALAPD